MTDWRIIGLIIYAVINTVFSYVTVKRENRMQERIEELEKTAQEFRKEQKKNIVTIDELKRVAEASRDYTDREVDKVRKRRWSKDE